MAYRFLGSDPVDVQIDAVLSELAAGKAPRDIERMCVDVKEESGRRSGTGVVLPGAPENEDAADYLAEEMACMANTQMGGAIILGIADDGTRTGTSIDPQWLRHRIFELTERKLAIDVREAEIDSTRILVLRAAPSIEPIRYKNHLKWRVDDHCVEVDAASWAAAHLYRAGYDWSAEPSGYRLEEASPVALDLARRYLSERTSDAAAADLAAAGDADLLRRLNIATGDGHLTNAGALLFVATPGAAIDYMHREYSGGDSTVRVEQEGPLIEQLYEVERAANASNRVIHQQRGFVVDQIHAIPPSALREAVVNGITHRDWQVEAPTTVEHIGDTVVVTSPGGFIAGVAPDNIITHPSSPRYRSLAQAMASLRLAERQGVGVDRMIREMLALGHARPDISEIAGPYVRTTLVGGNPNSVWMAFLSELTPPEAARNLDILLLLDRLVKAGWVDSAVAAPLLQRSLTAAESTVGHLGEITSEGQALCVLVAGVPTEAPPAWKFSDAVKTRVAPLAAPLATPSGKRAVILEWARRRGRVSTSEVRSLTGYSVMHGGTVLKDLEAEGLLEASRATKGRGFYYRPVVSS